MVVLSDSGQEVYFSAGGLGEGELLVILESLSGVLFGWSFSVMAIAITR